MAKSKVVKASDSKKGSFTDDLLQTEQQKTDFAFVTKRIPELQQSRVNHYNQNIDTIWAEADRDYVPHRLNSGGRNKKVVATDETKGWRGALVNLGSSDWQSDISQSNVYTKVQTALAILVDQNPSGVFSAGSRQYTATTELMRQLYQRSWEYAKSKPQLKLFVFNLAKYGWACARTYPLHLTRKVKVITNYDQENPEQTTYESKDVVEYNDIMRENLDPRNVWIDDMARPNQPLSLKDWCWRKVYDFDDAAAEFSKYSRWQYVQPGGNVQETISTGMGANNMLGPQKNLQTKSLVEVVFYENKAKDLFMVIANGVPVIIEPLPVADGKGIKKLSLWQTYWNLRHTESPYGIGIYEAIRFDQAVLDRFQNMTIDQITLSIYKMFFYQGTQSLSDTGDIRISPGVGRQVLDPKNINWLDVPGPGQDSYLGIQMMRKNLDESSGITDPLTGEITGKTAFEIAQAKEAALKRMKNPLDNVLEALVEEGYITVSLIQLLYSIPETYEIADPGLIADYLKEVGSDKELYDRETREPDEQGNVQPDKFTAKVYREFPLNLGEDEKENLIETQDTEFFRVKPSGLKWEGVINIKASSMLSPSKQVDKALEMEMYNVLIPLMQSVGQEYAMRQQSGQPVGLDDLTNGKVIKNIVKLYDKDPRDVIPDTWLKPPEAQPAPSLFLPQNAPTAQPNPNPDFPTSQQAPQAPTVVGSTAPPASPQSFSGQMSAAATQQ